MANPRLLKNKPSNLENMPERAPKRMETLMKPLDIFVIRLKPLDIVGMRRVESVVTLFSSNIHPL